jgi:hypothetical protein
MRCFESLGRINPCEFLWHAAVTEQPSKDQPTRMTLAWTSDWSHLNLAQFPTRWPWHGEIPLSAFVMFSQRGGSVSSGDESGGDFLEEMSRERPVVLGQYRILGRALLRSNAPR